MQSVEFSLDNSDAGCTGYYRRGLRIRLYMIVYFGNRLFYTCTVKGYNTGQQQWRNWRGCKGANLPLSKLNVKTGPDLAYISVFSILSVLAGCCCFVFFGSFLDCFPVISGFSIETYIRTHFLFSTFFWVLLSGPLSAMFRTLTETLVTPLVYHLTSLDNFVLDFTKTAYNQRGFSNATYETASLTRQMLTTKVSTMHFAIVGLDSRKLLVVWRSAPLTLKSEMCEIRSWWV